jgi:hypothetical protein
MFLAGKRKDMFGARTKKEGVDIRIYRDARLVVLLWLLLSLFFIFPAFTVKDKVEMLAVLSILMAGNILGCLVMWYMMHGAIVLNKTHRQVEFLKDLGLQAPWARYPVDTIEQVTVKPFAKGYQIALNLKGAREGELDLFFFNETACAQAAITIAEFARVPACDSQGRQIFNPKER